MSVLIMGMEMPKNCESCEFHQSGYPDWCDLSFTGKDIYNSSKRPDWCPLTDVPTPHGPLIDKAKLYNYFAKLEVEAIKTFDGRKPYDMVWSAIMKERAAFKFDVMDAEEIIPAEEGLREVEEHDSILTDPRYGLCIDCKMEGE